VWWRRPDVAYNVLAALAGIVIGPAVGLWLGTYFGRLGSALNAKSGGMEVRLRPQ
jgi:hypothetical protein